MNLDVDDLLVNILPLLRGRGLLGTSGTLDFAQVLELGALGLEGVGSGVVSVVKLAAVLVLLVRMLGGLDLAVLDGLDSAVVVILVDVLVDLGVDLLVLPRLDRLVLDGRCLGLVDRGGALGSHLVATAAGPAPGRVLEAARLTRAGGVFLGWCDVALEGLAHLAKDSAGKFSGHVDRFDYDVCLGDFAMISRFLLNREFEMTFNRLYVGRTITLYDTAFDPRCGRYCAVLTS